MRFLLLVPAFLALTGCYQRYDLPAGWDGASPIAGVTQTDSEVSEELALRLEGPDEDILVVEYLRAHFRCGQELQVFEMPREFDSYGGTEDSGVQDPVGGGELAYLVQPVEMDPESPRSCRCRQDLNWKRFEQLPGSYEVSLYRRWDNLYEDNDPVLIGVETIVIR